MPFNPPFSANPDQDVTAPPGVRLIIQASAQWFAEVGDSKERIAEEIVARNAGSIRQFWLAQTQNYRAGVQGVQTTHMRLQEVDLMLQVVQGSSILTVTVKPENTTTQQGGAAEVNLDGYIAWVCLQPSLADPHPMPTCTYTFFLNDEEIYSTSLAPQLGTVIFRFGPTALICHSLSDASNPNPTLTNEIIPERPKITVPVDHRDIPGYFVYDPSQGQDGDPFGTPDVLKDISANVAGSALLPEGYNTFRVDIQPPSDQPFRSTWTQGFRIYAEFYARAMVDKVRQSWKFSHTETDIAVNDKPLYFSMSTGPFPVQAMDFDLTPKKVDTTVVTPTNQGIAFPTPGDPATTNWAGTPLFLWKDQSKGYWRIGDPASGQLQPPFGLWALAIEAAAITLEASIDMMNWARNWGIPNPTPSVVPVSTAPSDDLLSYVSGDVPITHGASAFMYPFTANVSDNNIANYVNHVKVDGAGNPDPGGLPAGTLYDTYLDVFGFTPGTYHWVAKFGIGPDDLPDFADMTAVITFNFPVTAAAETVATAYQLMVDAYDDNLAVAGKDDLISVYAPDGGAVTSIMQSAALMTSIKALATQIAAENISGHFFQSLLIVDQDYPGGSTQPPDYQVVADFTATASGLSDPEFVGLNNEITTAFTQVQQIQVNAALLLSAIQGFDLQPV